MKGNYVACRNVAMTCVKRRVGVGGKGKGRGVTVTKHGPNKKHD
jgi:hypothetical protein